MQQEERNLEQEYSAAVEAAARQLSYRGLSASALRGKLMEKGHAEDAAEYAAAWLAERGLLDDGRFAEETARAYERRGYGPMRIAQELRRRGVTREDADRAMEHYEPDLDAMRALLDKRLRGDLSDRKAVDRAIAALQRRGFRWDDIRQAVKDYGAELEDGFD